jgi:hypothetical protein
MKEFLFSTLSVIILRLGCGMQTRNECQSHFLLMKAGALSRQFGPKPFFDDSVGQVDLPHDWSIEDSSGQGDVL